MIDAYLAKSPAAMKVPILLEELGLEYRIVPVAVSDGEQHQPNFRAVSPNDKVPAIVDHAPADGGAPLSLFESGAILLYLAEKAGRFLPADARGRATAMQWLFWQAAGLSPMCGQAVHFTIYAPESAKPYTQERYYREVNRLYGVLNAQLRGREFICGDYTIADMAAYTWTMFAEWTGQRIDEFPELQRWHQSIAARPAVVRAFARAEQEIPNGKVKWKSEEFRANMFGHTAKSLGLI